MTATDPADLGAAEARRLIARNALSPVELAEACIARIKALDHAVNAVVARDFDGLRAGARAAEAAEASSAAARAARRRQGHDQHQGPAHHLRLGSVSRQYRHRRRRHRGGDARGRSRYHRDWQAFLEIHDVLVSPAVTISPRAWRELYPIEIDGQPTKSYYHWLANAYASTIPGHPSITIPCGRHAHGMPFGLQIVGRRHDDLGVLAVAAEMEAVIDATDLGRAAAGHRHAGRRPAAARGPRIPDLRLTPTKWKEPHVLA